MAKPKPLLLLALPALAFLLLHLPALDYGFVWMDEPEIVHGTMIRPDDELLRVFTEPMLTSLDFRNEAIPQPFYRPLQVALVSLVHNRVGLQPQPFHGIGLAVGTLTVAVFTGLAWLLLRRVGPALLAGGIAAVHPAGLEVYVWIAGLSEALVDLFVLLALLAGVLALGSRGAGTAGLGLASVACVSLALLSKENGSSAPLLWMALLASLALGGPRSKATPAAWRGQRWRVPGLPILLGQAAAVAVLFLWWRPRVLGSLIGGAQPIGGDSSTQWLTSLACWPRMLGWLVAPLHSSSSDTVRIVSSATDPWVLAGVGLAVASLGLWVWLVWRGRWVAALGLAWIWIAYLPTSGLVPLLHPRGERYLHLSVFGLALLAGDLAAAALAGAPGMGARASTIRRRVVLGLGLVAVALLAQRTWQRQPDWRSTETLFTRDVERDPAYREGRHQLGTLYFAERRFREARQVLEPLVRPTAAMNGTTGFVNEAGVQELYCHTNLTLNRAGEAVVLLRRLARERPELAALPGIRLCQGRALEQAGRPVDALEVYLALAKSSPEGTSPLVRISVARAYATTGRGSEAAQWLDELPPELSRDSGLGPEIRRIRRMIRGR